MASKMSKIGFLCRNHLNARLPSVLHQSKRNTSELLHKLSEQPRHFKFSKYKKPKNQMEKLLVVEEDDIIQMFLSKTIDRKESTEANPNLVPSIESNRLIACQCDSEGYAMEFTLLQRGAAQQCACGHWFKIVDAISPFVSDKGNPF